MFTKISIAGLSMLALLASGAAHADTIATLGAGYDVKTDTTIMTVTNNSSTDFSDVSLLSGTYSLSFGPVLAGGIATFEFNDQNQGSPFGYDPDDGIIVPIETVYSFSVTEGGSTLTSDTFSSLSTNVDFLGYANGDGGLDPVTVATISAVPEPASMAILGAALGGLGLLRRRSAR